jgi:hypothetical protein
MADPIKIQNQYYASYSQLSQFESKHFFTIYIYIYIYIFKVFGYSLRKTTYPHSTWDL